MEINTSSDLSLEMAAIGSEDSLASKGFQKTLVAACKVS